MSNHPDGIIIGVGIIGASIAFELSKKGYKTLNIDKLPAAGYGSTGDSCAIIRTNYSTLEGTALAYDAYFDWKKWANHLELPNEKWLSEFKEVGFLVIEPRAPFIEKSLELHDTLKIPYEVWNWEQLKEKMPHFTDLAYYPPKLPDDPAFLEKTTARLTKYFVFFPAGGFVNDPQLAVQNIQKATEAKGGEFLFNSEVVEILKDGDKVKGVVLKDGRQIHAGFVVNAAGPHSFIVNRLAGIEGVSEIKTRALRREVHFLPSPEEFPYTDGVCVVADADVGVYHRPETGNQILVGSLDPDCDSREWIENPDDYNMNITNTVWKAQVYRLANRIPTLPIPNRTKGIVSLYDVSDDWIPIYDRSDLKGFYLAIGTSGNQFKNGPTVGRLMADIIENCEKGHDHDENPLQVKLQNLNIDLDTSIFSRNRELNPESTYTVLG